MAESRSGLQKKVSSIFEGTAVAKTGDGQSKAIVPLLARNENVGITHEEQKEGMKVNLVRFRKSGTQQVIELPSAVTVIGRRRNCDLRIPLHDISKRHCQINCDDGTLKIRDLGSKNGTLLNGLRITEAVVQPGDWIQVGQIGFVFQIDGKPEKVTAPVLKEPEKAKPKKVKAATKAAEKAAKKAEAKIEEENFDKLDSSDVSSILDADLKESSDAGDILIDDSELLKEDSDLKLDDLDLGN
jgi:predicted component of type VI protein secretion system